MKKRTQSKPKKSSSNPESTTSKFKKTQTKNNISKNDLNQQSDFSQQIIVPLETFQKEQRLEENEIQTQFRNMNGQSESYMVESFENIMDYDPAIMEEIEKEIYQAQIQRTISPIQKLKDIQCEFTNDQEIIEDIQQEKKDESIKESKSIKFTRRQKKVHESNTSNVTQKIQTQSEEQQIIVPQKVPTKKTFNKKSLKSQENNQHKISQKMNPAKKLKSQQEVNNKMFLNFTINLKLLKSNLSVKKVMKCLESNDIYNRQAAKFLIETQDGEQHVLSNEEMVCFYKDILIDYYQGIHFS